MKRFSTWLFAALAFAAPAFAQSPPVCVVSGQVLNGGSQPIVGTQVRFRVISPVLATTGAALATQDLTTVTDASGNWSLTLVQGLNAQVDIPAVGIAKDTVIPTGAQCPATFAALTLFNRGTLTPATILSTTGPSMGGDLTGSSPNPTVVGLRGQILAAGACTNGQARVYNAGTTSFTCQNVIGGGVTSITAGTGITVGGTASVPIVGIAAAGVTATQLGAGAAATNLGAAGGALTGTYPSPTLAGGVAAANLGAAGGDLSGTYPSPSVATVGAQTAATVAAGAVLANAATAANTPSTIVRRDGSGNFVIGTITGALTGNAATATAISGSFTGDISNVANAMTVTGLRGRPVGNTAPSANQVLSWTGSQWDAASAVGTVTSVAASGGGTGMSFSGSPIVGAGTLTLQGVLNVANGGTGAASANAGFNTLSPMNTVGDLIFEGAGPIAARLAGNAGATKQFLSSTGSAGLATPPVWTALVSGDIPNNGANTSGTAAGLSATLVVGSGGTGQTTAAAAFNALAPTTTLGDTIYANGAGTNTRLAGNITTTKNFQVQTGNGAVSAAPAWGTIVSGDLPASIAANTSGTAAGLSSTLVVASGGTGATTLTGVLHGNGVGAVTGAPASLTADVSGILPIANGGTAQATATAAFNGLMPLTTLGDTLYASGANTAARLAGNTAATKQFYSETGNGVTSAAPAWGLLVAGDIPNLPASILTSGTVATAQLPSLAGDVTGTIVANTVGKIQGNTVLSGTPTNLQVLQWITANSRWEPTTLPGGGVTSVNGSGGSTGLTLTGGGTGAVTLTLGGTLAIANGGTNATTANGAFNALSPMTTLGDVIFGGAAGVGTRLAGNTTTTPTFLRSTGAAGLATAPTFSQVNAGTDLAGVLPTANGGTNASSWTTGSVPYLSNATTFAQDNGNFFWDGTNHRLGLGTAAPTAKLHVHDTAATTAVILEGNSGTGRILDMTGADRTWSWVQGGSLSCATCFGLRDGFVNTVRFLFDGSGNFGLGSLAPDSPLTVSSNVSALRAPSASTMVHLVQQDANGARIGLDSYGATAGAIEFRQAAGTNATPTGVTTGAALGAYGAKGYGATGYAAALRGQLLISSDEAGNWTDTVQGTRLGFFTTPAGGIATAETMRLTGAGLLGIGTTAPDSLLTMSSNVSIPRAPTAATLLHLIGTDSVGARIGIDAYGSVAALEFRQAGGSNAIPTATATNTTLGNVGAKGYGATGYSSAVRAQQLFASDEAGSWTDAAQGTRITWATTLDGSTTLAEGMRLDNAGHLGIGTTAPEVTLDQAGGHQFRGGTSPGVSSSNNARLYYDLAAQQLKISQNGGAYINLLGAGAVSGSGTTDQITLWSGGTSVTGNALFVRTSGSGFVGINTGSPGQFLDVNGTARLEPVASTASSNGDTWTDSTQKSLMSFQAGATQAEVGTLFTQTNTVTYSNSAAELTIMGTGVGTKTLPANFWVPGKTVKLEVWGYIPTSTAGTPVYTWKVKFGTVTIPAGATIGDQPGAGNPWKLEFLMTCRTTGAGGTVFGQGKLEIGNVGSRYFPMIAVGAIDTTITGLIDVTIQAGSAVATDSVASTNAAIRVLN